MPLLVILQTSDLRQGQGSEKKKEKTERLMRPDLLAQALKQHVLAYKYIREMAI